MLSDRNGYVQRGHGPAPDASMRFAPIVKRGDCTYDCSKRLRKMLPSEFECQGCGLYDLHARITVSFDERN